jgi:hypothetical protein
MQFLEPMLAGRAASRIVGLPYEERLAPVLTVALSSLLGKPFNYRQQNDGALAQRIQSRAGAPANSNASPEPFGWHCDDSGLRPDYRTEWITLFGVRNPTAVTTGIALVDDLIDAAAAAGIPVHEALRPQFSKRLPKSFNLGEDVWVDGLPLIGCDPHGRPTVAWPTYATRPTDPTNRKLIDFLAALEAKIDKVARHVAVEPGHFLVFSNDHVLHCRSAVGDADRLLLRTYVRRDLKALAAVTGEPGPIFDLERIIARQFAATARTSSDGEGESA